MTRFVPATETRDEGKNRHTERQGPEPGSGNTNRALETLQRVTSDCVSTGTPAVERLTALIYSPTNHPVWHHHHVYNGTGQHYGFVCPLDPGTDK